MRISRANYKQGDLGWSRELGNMIHGPLLLRLVHSDLVPLASCLYISIRASLSEPVCCGYGVDSPAH